MATTTVIVADDHPVVREGIIALFRNDPDFTVVGTASAAGELLELVRSTPADLLLLDLSMPGMSGPRSVKTFRQARPGMRVLIVSAYANRDMRGLVAAGIDGYALKDEDPDRLLEAARAVASGRHWYSQRIASRALADLVRPQEGEPLTDREVEVLQALAKDLSTQQIAKRLSVSTRTVQNHITALTAKLGVRTRTAAVAEGFRRGLLELVEDRAEPLARREEG